MATIPAISQFIGGLPSSSRCAASILCERKSPMTALIITVAPNYRGLGNVLHAQFLHFASQRIAAPAQEFGRVLLQAVGLAQRHAY